MNATPSPVRFYRTRSEFPFAAARQAPVPPPLALPAALPASLPAHAASLLDNLLASYGLTVAKWHMRFSVRRAFLSLGMVLAALSNAAENRPNQLSADERAQGWTLLFDGKTTAGWHSFQKSTFPAKGWSVEEGWLYCAGKGGGDIVSEAQFEHFELVWEYRQQPSGNSGVKYFVVDSRRSPLGHEFQMLDDCAHAAELPGKGATGSFYDVLPPTSIAAKPPGELNQARILVRGNHVEHWLNGIKVIEYECGSDVVKAAVAKSKFKNTTGFGTRMKGHILLQDHGTPCWFRNVRIRDLSKEPGSN